jgi:Concanavalin A-like lectin/glucanases superfamily/Bacterial Ig-like domain (group 3)
MFRHSHGTPETRFTATSSRMPVTRLPRRYRRLTVLLLLCIGALVSLAPGLAGVRIGTAHADTVNAGFDWVNPGLGLVAGADSGSVRLALTSVVPSVNVALAPNPTVDWGDGTVDSLSFDSNSFDSGSPCFANTNFAIRCYLYDHHTYAAEGTYQITITYYVGALVSYTGRTIANVVTPTMVFPTPYNFYASSGASFSGTVATFSDDTATDPASVFSASIDWGDDTTSAGTVTGAGGFFGVQGSHIYTTAGSYAVDVKISYTDTTVDVYSTGYVSAAPTNAAAVNVLATAGSTYSGSVATFSAAGAGARAGDYYATIDWGDGTPTYLPDGQGTITANGSGFLVTGTHAYATSGTYATRIQIMTGAGTSVTATGSATALTCTHVTSAYSTAVLADSPVGYWHLDGGCFTDSSGNGHNGTVQGGVTPNQPGAPVRTGETSAAFDGSTGYISLGDPTALQPDQVSVEAWINTTAHANPVNAIVRKRFYGYELYLDGAGIPVFNTYTQTSLNTVAGNASVADGAWHHLVGTYDGQQARIFVDGQLINTTVCIGGPVYYQPDLVTIGRDGGVASGYFSGRIDEVAIYGAGLSAAQVQAHFAAAVGQVKRATATTVTSSSSSSVAGQSVTFSASISPNAGPVPSGTVTFDDGTTALGTGVINGSGVATFTTSSLSVSSHAISAIYGGDTNFVGSTSAALTQTVNKALAGVAASSTTNPSTHGQSAILTARISASAPGAGTPSGTVAFKDGATTLAAVAVNGNGVATYTSSSLAVGTHSITAFYSGDGNFHGAASTVLVQTVNKAATTTTVTSSTNPSLAGGNVTFSATVSAVAPGAGMRTGTVTFMDGAATLGSGAVNATGVATFSIAGLGQGGHAISAVYGGDANYTGSTSSVLTQIVNAASRATTTVVTSSSSPSVFGQNVTFSATINPHSGPVPTGTVTFKDGATVLGTGAVNGSGVATYSTSSLSVANHTITAVYGGDANFNGSTSPGIFQTVSKAATTTAVTSAANPALHGQSVTFTATVSPTTPGTGTLTGTVYFRDGATTLGSGAVNAGGVATFSISSLVVGTHNITAYYAGDANFSAGTSATITQTVNQVLASVALTSSLNPSTHGTAVTFTATISAVAPGAGTPSGTVTFTDGATTLIAVALNGSGVATFTTSSLAVGTHSITANYSGDGNFHGAGSAALVQTVN